MLGFDVVATCTPPDNSNSTGIIEDCDVGFKRTLYILQLISTAENPIMEIPLTRVLDSCNGKTVLLRRFAVCEHLLN